MAQQGLCLWRINLTSQPVWWPLPWLLFFMDTVNVLLSRSCSVLLASGSPRRQELLQQIGVDFDRVVVDVAEIRQPGETPESFVVRVAGDKAAAGRQQRLDDPRPVIGADTAVVLGNQVFGKPQDYDHAAEMLRALSGVTHQVLSAVVVVPQQGEPLLAVCASDVTFRAISEAEISAYWQTGEPLGKAGGYAIQGRAALFVERLVGSYSAVMGLPLFETARLLETALANG